MQLVLTGVDGRVEIDLRDAWNFRALSVLTEGLDEVEADHAVVRGELGAVEGEHVWLDTRALRRTGPTTPDWGEGFDAMISVAQAHGWVSPDGRRVRAHRERT